VGGRMSDTKQYYIFNGGLPENRYKGMKCYISFVFESDPNYGVICFDDKEVEKKGLGLSFEVADLRKLEEIV
jgi:hypothetical protein